jgi:ferric-dicitrate binding protein FerR (iron transport regulator)
MADLAAGNDHLARARLKGLLSTYPSDGEIRAALAAAYRAYGDVIQAGRWRYLTRPSSGQDEVERAAFEKWSRDAVSRLALLRWPAGADAVLDADGQAILIELRAAVTAQRRREERGCGLLVLVGLILLLTVIYGGVRLLGSRF